MIKKSLSYALLATTTLGLVIASCAGPAGKDGAPGATGTQGADGTEGEGGPPGPPGMDLSLGAAGASGENSSGLINVSCLSPCHGFAGIVAQSQTSAHFAAYVANLGGTEADAWTAPSSCGNCHAIDAVAQRVAGNVAFVGTTGPTDALHGKLGYIASTTQALTEATYAGNATVASVDCSTCHDTSAGNDPHLTGSAYVKGSFPLRIATGPADQMLIEKGSALGTSDGTPAGKFNLGNVCISCHRSRKDVTNYILASNTLTSVNWGPHEGPQADVYSGKGGYAFAGMKYGNSSHQSFTNGCVDCHMPAAADTNQGIGNHSFNPQLSTCQHAGCHVEATSFDVIGGPSAMKANMQELRVVLNTAGYLTRGTAAPYPALSATDLLDLTFSLDQVRPGATGLSADTAGALYNYLLVARGSANGVHNPVYTRELIYDSYKSLVGTAPTTLPTRP
jgi:hypothetical protein